MNEKEVNQETMEVEEPITPSDSIETSDQEEVTLELPLEQPDANKPYTDEEANEILESGGELDAKRLTAAQKLIQKSFDKHFTRRFQEAADARRMYEAKAAEVSAPKTIYEAFDNDPAGVMSNIRTILYQKKAEDPFSDEVLKLESLRDDLVTYSMKKSERERIIDGVVSENDDIIREAIPDFNESKAQELTKFAMEELGLTNNEVAYLTNNAHGKIAAKITVAINSLHKKLRAGDSAERKAVKLTPIPLGRAGESRQEEVKPALNLQAISDDKFEEMLNSVKFKGAKLKI